MNKPRIHAARQAAAELLRGVLQDGRHLGAQVEAPDSPFTELEPPERARATTIALGVLRHLSSIDRALDPHLRKAPPLGIRMILRMATWELLCDGIPPHAVVNSAVEVAKARKKTSYHAKLINAVMRSVEKARTEDWVPQPERLPKTLRSRLGKAYGTEAVAAMERAHGVEPPLDLTPRDPANGADLAARLDGTLLPTGSIRLARRGQISALPGYDSGEWWVQDAAAAMPARLFGDVKGARCLDLCAAPGGKTMQLAAAGGDVTALDEDADRLVRVSQNLDRTGLTAQIVTADATEWTPDGGFDVILLDAPCSATGTIRRHPDLPHLRALEDLAYVTGLQAQLLDRALGWLNPGGRLVFATCSLLPDEGEAQLARVLSDGRAKASPLVAAGLDPAWITEAGALRLRPDYWPETGGMDGFFAALMTAG